MSVGGRALRAMLEAWRGRRGGRSVTRRGGLVVLGGDGDCVRARASAKLSCWVQRLLLLCRRGECIPNQSPSGTELNSVANTDQPCGSS